MRCKFFRKLVAVALSLCVLSTDKVNAQSLVPAVKVPDFNFKCLPYGTDFWITVAQKREKEAALFIWHRQNFSSHLPPELACELLSQRLTNLVVKNQGNFDNLLLTMGRVDGETVLCIVNSMEKGCNSTNILLPVTVEDWVHSEQFLQQLTGFPASHNLNTVFNTVSHPMTDMNRQPYFRLEQWENQYLKAEKYETKFKVTTEGFSF